MILCTQGNHWADTVTFCCKCHQATCKKHGEDVGERFYCANCLRVFGDELRPGRPYSNMPAPSQGWDSNNPFRQYVDDL